MDVLSLALWGVIGLGLVLFLFASLRNARPRGRREVAKMPTYASGNARGLRIPPDEPDFRMEVGELPDPDPGARPDHFARQPDERPPGSSAPPDGPPPS